MYIHTDRLLWEFVIREMSWKDISQIGECRLYPNVLFVVKILPRSTI
jgi:hypothetical protein